MVKNRTELREWLTEHSQIEKECWVVIKRGRLLEGDANGIGG